MNGTLEFAINSNEEAADLEALEEEGYEVEFLASKELLKADDKKEQATKNTTGKVDAETEFNELDDDKSLKFEYQVVVSKDDEEVAKSDRKEVEVLDYANSVTEITSVDVELNNGVVLDSNKLAEEEEANLVVKGMVKGNDEEVTITDNVEFKGDRPALATIENNVVTTKSVKGDYTVTITSGDLEEEVVLNVGNTAREADKDNSTIAVDELELAAGTDSNPIRVELKDQYGDDFVVENLNKLTATDDEDVDEDVNVLKASEATEVKEDSKTVLGSYDLVLTAADKKAEGNVVVKADDVDLGEIKVTVLEAGDAVAYELKAVKTELDIKKVDEDSVTTELTLNSLDEKGLVVESLDLSDDKYVVKSSDEDVAKIIEDGKKVEAVAIGTTSITVSEKKGAFTDEIATLDITVVDSTPTMDVTFKDVADVTETKDIALKDILEVKLSSNEDAIFQVEGDVLVIKEEDAEGVKLGEVRLDPEDSYAKFNKAGEVTKLEIDKIAEKVNDKLTVSVLDKDDKFVGQTEINVELLATAPESEVTKLNVKNTTVEKDNLLFFVDGITEPTWNSGTGEWDHPTKTREKAVKLSEVVTFFEEKGATFNTEALSLNDGKLTLVESKEVLSAEDYPKMKTTAEEPYRITVMQLDDEGDVKLDEANKRLKAGKIAMYQDGTVIFESAVK